jgi:hypothetical protein
MVLSENLIIRKVDKSAHILNPYNRITFIKGYGRITRRFPLSMLGGKSFDRIYQITKFTSQRKTLNMKSKKKITKKILKMAKREQSLRMKYLKTNSEEDFQRVKDVDKINREDFKKIFKETGYISSKYGKEVQLAAFLIVQHMPKDDTSFMKEYLSLMKDDLENINPLNYAQLVDRVRIYEGKNQLYGTQFTSIEGKKDTYRLHKIYNSKKVDKRRKEIGLEPLKEYLEQISKERNITITI